MQSSHEYLWLTFIGRCTAYFKTQHLLAFGLVNHNKQQQQQQQVRYIPGKNLV